MAMEQQKIYCKINNLPFFAPYNSVCWNCRKVVNDDGEKHITGCPHCHTTFCD